MSHTLTLAECQAIVEGWREDQHPRGFGGKFGSGTGVAKSDSSGGSKPAASGAPASKTPAKKAPAKAKAAAPAKAPAKASTSAKGKSAPVKAAPPPPAKDKQFLTDHYTEWRGKLSPAQSKALTGYQGADYDLMNGQARGNSKAPEADLERAAKANRALKAAINKAPPTTEPMTVYRSVPAGALGGLKSGMVVTDKGFVSTSLTPGKDGKQATVEITLPEGTRAAAGTNRELVLPPGGKFRVVEVGEKDGAPHVRMEYVPPAVRKSRAKPKADAAAPDSKPAAKASTQAAPEDPKATPETPTKKAPAKRKAPAKAKATPAAAPAEPATAEPEVATDPPKKAPAKRKAPAKAAAKTAPETDPTRGMNSATRHMSDEDGVEWLAKKMPKIGKRDEQSALRHYTGPGFIPINKALRNPTAARDPRVQAQIDQLDAAMAKSTVPEDVIVHRGVGADYAQRLGGDLGDPASMRALIGKVDTEDAYISTSAGAQAALGKDVQLMMRVPKGMKAINVMPLSASKNERELLLDRDSSWVIHDVYESKGRWFIEAEAVPKGWKPGTDWAPSSAGDADDGYAHAVPDEEYYGSPDSEYYDGFEG